MSHGHPLLERDRQVSGSMPADELDALFAHVAEHTVDREPTVLDRLQELPTAVRATAAAAAMLAVGAVALAFLGVRSDVETALLPHFVGTLLFLISAAVGSAGLGLRGLHQPPLGRQGTFAVAIFLLLPVGLAVLPGWWPSSAAPQGWTPHTRCLLNGVGTTTAVTVLLLVFQRSPIAVPWRVLAAAAAGGLAGMTVQQLACPAGGMLHVLGAHSLLGLMVGAGVLGVAALRR